MARVALYQGPERGFELVTIEVPEPESDQLLARVLACTLCGSDLHTLQGRRQEPIPSILGHEILGRVEAIGSRFDRRDARGNELNVGDRITWSIAASCGRCLYCTTDMPQKCLSLIKYGHSVLRDGRDLLGGLADYCWLKPGTTIVKVKEHVSNELLCPANCATATIMSALEEANVQKTDSVLVLGAGMLGLTALVALRGLHGIQADLCDLDRGRLGRAKGLGARSTITPDEAQDRLRIPDGVGWSIVIDTAGSSKAVEMGLQSLRIGGKLILVGSVFPDRAISIVPEQIVRKCLHLIGVHNYKPRHLVRAVEFLESAKSHGLEQLVSRWLPLEEIASAAHLACHTKEFVRVGISMEAVPPSHGSSKGNHRIGF